MYAVVIAILPGFTVILYNIHAGGGGGGEECLYITVCHHRGGGMEGGGEGEGRWVLR